MYIRYVILKEHRDTRKEMGVFQAFSVLEASLLERGLKLQDYELEWKSEALTWFNQNVKTASNIANNYPKATYWFKASAKDCIDRVQMLVLLLEQYGFHTKRIEADKFDYILYEDEYQVLALSKEDVPYKEARRYEKYRKRRQ
ncbi:MAG: hypothetical protein ACREA2_11325 [Blastocatellia bacterium]